MLNPTAFIPQIIIRYLSKSGLLIRSGQNYILPLLILLFVFMVSPSIAQDYGATDIDPSQIGAQAGTDLAERIFPPSAAQPSTHFISPWTKYTDDWDLILSDSLTASIPVGMQMCAFFDPNTEYLELIDPTIPLSATQTEALERAPDWLRFDLYDAFRRYEYSMIADWAAQTIIDAPDPYVDEVAFQVAHISPALLGGSMYLDLLQFNAELIYEIDDALDFVEIVDYGSTSDEDYYSTTRYTTMDESGNPVTMEVDREIYYWYVVHPKLSDELPTYIDPSTGLAADPPDGVFWRDYLWNHADSGYVMYNTVWEGVEYMWDRGDTSFTDAISTVNSWVDNVMNWGAGSERPIQPVRIYALHCGNCGEYQDIRAAAGRIALIPSICTSNICEDHVWNEFWAMDAEEWIHWDGGSINNPLLYENGWGKTLSAVFNWRGDGYIWTCTEMYSADVCTLNVTLSDSTGKPADGIRVKIYADFYYGGVYYTTWGVTNSSGQVSFLLGDDHTYYIRLEGELGTYPPTAGAYSMIIDNSEPGAVYAWEHAFNNASPALGVEQGEEIQNPLDDYLLEIEYNCVYETMYQSFFTINGISTQFSKKNDPGVLDFFMADQNNYLQYSSFQPAEGYNILDNTSSGLISYTIPNSNSWFGVFSAREVSVNRPTLQVNVNVYRNSNVGVEKEITSDLPTEFALDNPYPNPFNHEASLSFAVPRDQHIKIAVFDLQGRVVDILTDGLYAPGYYDLKWRGNNISSGIYFLSMTAGTQQFSQKLCLIK